MERRRIIGIVLLALAGAACLMSVVWNLIRMPEGADARIRIVVFMLFYPSRLQAAIEREGSGNHAESHRPRRLPLHYAGRGSSDLSLNNQHRGSQQHRVGPIRKLDFHHCHPCILYCRDRGDVLVDV